MSASPFHRPFSILWVLDKTTGHVRLVDQRTDHPADTPDHDQLAEDLHEDHRVDGLAIDMDDHYSIIPLDGDPGPEGEQHVRQAIQQMLSQHHGNVVPFPAVGNPKVAAVWQPGRNWTPGSWGKGLMVPDWDKASAPGVPGWQLHTWNVGGPDDAGPHHRDAMMALFPNGGYQTANHIVIGPDGSYTADDGMDNENVAMYARVDRNLKYMPPERWHRRTFGATRTADSPINQADATVDALGKSPAMIPSRDGDPDYLHDIPCQHCHQLHRPDEPCADSAVGQFRQEQRAWYRRDPNSFHGEPDGHSQVDLGRAAATDDPKLDPGSYLANAIGGHWRPEGQTPDDLSGTLSVGDASIQLGMGTTESDGQWLHVVNMQAQPTGRGIGSKVIEALRAWSAEVGVPLRFESIENTDFFNRWPDWQEARLSPEDEPDGEAWYYPPSSDTTHQAAAAEYPKSQDHPSRSGSDRPPAPSPSSLSRPISSSSPDSIQAAASKVVKQAIAWDTTRFDPLPGPDDGTLNWQPGQWGKGAVIAGKPHTWRTEGPSGSPHHQQYMQGLGYDANQIYGIKPDNTLAPEGRLSTDWVTITPHGYYTDHSTKHHEGDPAIFARVSPGLRYMPDKDKWQLRAFSSHQAAASQVMYHHSPSSNRVSIAQEGLKPHWDSEVDIEPGVFLTREPSPMEGEDTWEVNVDGLSLKPDPWGEVNDVDYLPEAGGSYYVAQHVGPDRIRRIASNPHPDDPKGDWEDDGGPPRLAASSVPLDQVVYIAEGAMERAGATGRSWHVPDDEVKSYRMQELNQGSRLHPVEEEMTAFAREVTGDSHIKVRAAGWFSGGDITSGETDLLNYISVRFDTTDLVILHECAHVLRAAHGHDAQYCHIAHDLYSRYISPEAGEIFWNLVSFSLPDVPNPDWEPNEVPSPDLPNRQAHTRISGMDEYAEMVPIEALKRLREWDRRPGSGTAAADPQYYEQLKQHIAQHGIENPLSLEYNPSKGTGYLGEGNHRLNVAEDLGHTHVPLFVYRSTKDDERMQPMHAPGTYLMPNARGFSQFGQYMRPSDIGMETAGPFEPTGSESHIAPDVSADKLSAFRAKYAKLLHASGHQLWFKPSAPSSASQTWGRGVLHLPTGTVHTWPEDEAEHDQAMQAKGFEDSDAIRFILNPQGVVNRIYGPDWSQSQTSASEYLRQIAEADPALARANGLDARTSS